MNMLTENEIASIIKGIWLEAAEMAYDGFFEMGRGLIAVNLNYPSTLPNAAGDGPMHIVYSTMEEAIRDDTLPTAMDRVRDYDPEMEVAFFFPAQLSGYQFVLVKARPTPKEVFRRAKLGIAFPWELDGFVVGFG